MTLALTHSATYKTGSMGAYIINLDRSKERYASILEPVKALGYPVERISAVDGSSIPANELEAMVDFKHFQVMFKNSPKIGTIGCSLSHFKTWQALLDSPYEYALIFEDDVTFEVERVTTILQEVIRYKEWDICSLDISHRGFPLTVADLPLGHKLAVYLTEIRHTGCYLINRKGAEILIKKSLPIRMPIDHYFTRIWESGLTFVGVENPRLVRQTFGDSEINQSKALSDKDTSFQTQLYRGSVRLHSYIWRFFSNLHRFLKLKMAFRGSML